MYKKIIKYSLLGLILFIIFSNFNFSFFINTSQGVTINDNSTSDFTESSIENLFKEAQEHYYRGNWEKTEKIYNQILKLQPENKNALKNLIFLYKNMGNYNKVIQYYDRLITLEPENNKLRFEYGIILYQIGEYNHSIKILNKLNQTNFDFLSARNHSLYYFYLGKCFYKLNDVKQALEYFNKGISIQESLVLNYLGKAEIYINQKDYKKAISAYEKALKWDESLSNLYSQLGTLYEKINDYKNAFQYWKKSKESGINEKTAQKNMSSLLKKYPKIEQPEEKTDPEPITKINWKDIKLLKNTENIPEIKIGLIENASKITFISQSQFDILDTDNNILMRGSKDTKWQIKIKNGFIHFYNKENLIKKIKHNGSIFLKPQSLNSVFMLNNIKFGKGYFWAGQENRQYRGTLELKPENSSSITIINIVNIEEYLLSVVPAEMPSWWPLESLKAQTIAARSYALNNFNRHKEKGYNLCATVHCAVYKGVKSENSRTYQAVKETRGEVATYKGEIINAVFSSNSGGFTESSEDVWQSKVPYLRGTNNMKNENHNFPLSPYELENWLKNIPPSYSNNSNFAGFNKYRWIKPISADFLKEKYNLKQLKNVIPLRTSKGGSIKKLKIQGREKEIIINKDSIRSALGGLRSNRFIIQRIYNSQNKLEKLILFGGGWGHNVGLDQTAAADMAQEGFNYKDIIFHFYPDTKISKLY